MLSAPPRIFSLASLYLRRIDRLFLAIVVVPTVFAAIYYGFIASDVYLSESRFVVRTPQVQAASPLSALFQRAGFSRAHDDGYVVQEFILSRDALRALNQTIALDKAYRSDAVDRLSRFAGLGQDDSFEALYRYYQDKIQVTTDSSSSVVTLTVRAFTPQDAVNANRALLEQSEALVNRLNERGRKDLIRYAQAELLHAEQNARTAALALSSYRNRQGVLDPDRQASLQLQQVAKLQDELITTNTQLAHLQRFTPSNPQIAALQNRSRTLQEEIGKERSEVTGNGRSLANKASEFQRLALDAELANKQLASALASLENARSDAQRQQVYLERIAEPSRPDASQEPKRLRSVITILIAGLATFAAARFLRHAMTER